MSNTYGSAIGPWIRDDDLLCLLQDVLGTDIVRRVWRKKGEDPPEPYQENLGFRWDASTLKVELVNGRVLTLSNSEWASVRWLNPRSRGRKPC